MPIEPGKRFSRERREFSMLQQSMKAIAIASLVAVFLLMTGVASAQTTKVPVLVDYYANNYNGSYVDGTLRITNFGSTGGGPAPNGNLCAMIYVFDTAEELQECCGCVLTPDGFKTLSVCRDLTSNPNNNETLYTGEIKIITSPPNAGGGCDPSFGGPGGTVTVSGALAAWGTHVQNVDGSYQVTETASQLENASPQDVNRIAKFLCGSIVQNSTGRGICSCGTGD